MDVNLVADAVGAGVVLGFIAVGINLVLEFMRKGG